MSSFQISSQSYTVHIQTQQFLQSAIYLKSKYKNFHQWFKTCCKRGVKFALVELKDYLYLGRRLFIISTKFPRENTMFPTPSLEP